MKNYSNDYIKQEFEKWLLSKGKSENTIKSYLKVVSYFETWFMGKQKKIVNYAEVHPVEIREWKQYLLRDAKKRDRSPLSVKTVNNYIESLKTFFLFLVTCEHIKYNPMEDIKPQKVKTEYIPRWLEPKEKKQVVKVIEDMELKKKNPWRYARNRFIVFAMLHGGLRISELLNLSIHDFKEGYLQIREGKGQVARDVPVNTSLTNALEEWLEERSKKAPTSEYLVLSQKGGKLTPSGVYKLFDSIIDKTKIKDLTPHTLRHTFAHDLLEKGFSITYVAALLGHSDLDTTRLYTSPKKKNLRFAVETLSDEV